MNQTYVENNFALWTNLLSDNAVIYLNNSKVDKATIINGFKFHHTIFNDIQIPNIVAQTNYKKTVLSGLLIGLIGRVRVIKQE